MLHRYDYNLIKLIAEASISLIKHVISEVKLNRLRFNIGTDGIFIYKINENAQPLKIEIPFNIPILPEQS